MTCWIGIDTGGTFTDFVAITDGALRTHKVLSTPAAPEQAILQGLADLGLTGDSAPPLQICHGSTIATNALLEGKGVRTAFITNEGFEDMLLLGRQAREALYDLTPAPSRRVFQNTAFFGLPVRRSATGELLTPLTEAAMDSLHEQLAAWRPESIAVNFLFSYVDGSEEKRLRDYLPANVFITLSSELLPRHEEYERGVAVWLNAWLGPLVGRYLIKLQDRLSSARVAVMQSSGLTMAADQAAHKAVHLLLSGPAGGVAAAAYIAHQRNEPFLLTLDMGGTSTDVSLVAGNPVLTDRGTVGPYPVAIPMVDIHTIGAGGGSLASIDMVGMLRVGPASAGATPGPVCYGQGGEQVTVTDANLYLGYLIAEKFLGGRMQLHADLAAKALERLGQSLNMTAAQVAAGIIRIVNEHMTQALRMITLERGRDARKCTLFCFGGAGGLHLCALAENLGIKRAIVPEYSGVLSAFGMLVARGGRELSFGLNRPLAELQAERIGAGFARLVAEGTAVLELEGIAACDIQVGLSLELRYQGQTHAVRIPWVNQAEAAEAFTARHQELYGFSLARTIELVNLRVSLVGPERSLAVKQVAATRDPASSDGSGAIPVWERVELGGAQVIAGPAIITDEASTTLVQPGWTCRKEEDGCLLLRWLEPAASEG